MYFFDLDHTILDFERSEIEALLELFDSRGIALSEEQLSLYRETNSKWWSYLALGEKTKDEVVLGRFVDYCSSIGVSFSPEELNDEYLTRLSKKAYFLPGAREFLTTMRRLGKRMAVITNGVYRVQHNRFLSAGLPEFFEFSLSSEEAGAAKPTPKSSSRQCVGHVFRRMKSYTLETVLSRTTEAQKMRELTSYGSALMLGGIVAR